MRVIIKLPPTFAVALLLAGALQSLHADVNGYLGVNTSISHWQMGLASGKTVQMFGSGYQSNKPDPFLYMAGVSASLVWNKTWAVSYQGEAGVAYPKIILTNTETDSGGTTQSNITMNPNIFRTDHSLALSRMLGASGFSIFIGAKVQVFSYSQPDAKFVKIKPATTENNEFSIRQKMLSYGPAAGISYAFRPYKKVFASVQGGFIYFPGQYTANVFVAQNNEINEAQEKYYGLGFTTLVSVSIPFSDHLYLQLAARGQYYRITTLESTTKKTNSAETSVAGTLDNVQDILLGMQVSVIYRLF